MNYIYKMFEKELTKGNHVSYHFIYDYFETLSPKNSKLYQYEKQLKDIVTKNFDLQGFQNAITTPNTTLKEDAHFHVGLYKRFIDDEVKDFFHIKSDFPVVYFTKKINDAVKESSYKCGYSYSVLKELNHPLEEEVTKLMKLFEEETSQSIFASHFKEDGDINDNEMNFEIIPHYNKQTFFSIKQKLLKNFDVREEILNSYDKKFANYKKEDFHYHVKIKLKKSETTVKFYRTFPINPYVF